MKIVHIVRDNYTPLALNGVYKVIDNISKALSDGGGKYYSMQCSSSCAQ